MLNAETGAWIVPPRFDRMCRWGVATMAIADEKRGYLDKSGAWLIEPKYDRLGLLLGEGLLPAKIGDKWAVIDLAENIVLDAKYDEGVFFNEGVAWAKTGASWCAIDRRGEQIPGTQCQATDPLKRDFSRIACDIWP